jgi:hypothetical protein
MVNKADRRLSQLAPCLDFKRIESLEISLDHAARQRIRHACAEFLIVATRLNKYPPLDAVAARRAARAIQRKAASARNALSELVPDVFDAVTHGLTFAEETRGDGMILLVKHAIDNVAKVGLAAERRLCEVHRPGRPELQDFKRLVVELYCAFRASGGKGQIVWDRNRQCYRGYPLFFVRRVLEQVRPFVPKSAMGKLLPARDSAVARMAAEAIRKFGKSRQKTLRKEGPMEGISASRRIRHRVRRGDTVRS